MQLEPEPETDHITTLPLVQVGLPPPGPRTGQEQLRLQPEATEHEVDEIFPIPPNTVSKEDEEAHREQLRSYHIDYFKQLKAWFRVGYRYRQLRYRDRLAALGLEPIPAVERLHAYSQQQGKQAADGAGVSSGVGGPETGRSGSSSDSPRAAIAAITHLASTQVESGRLSAIIGGPNSSPDHSAGAGSSAGPSAAAVSSGSGSGSGSNLNEAGYGFPSGAVSRTPADVVHTASSPGDTGSAGGAGGAGRVSLDGHARSLMEWALARDGASGAASSSASGAGTAAAGAGAPESSPGHLAASALTAVAAGSHSAASSPSDGQLQHHHHSSHHHNSASSSTIKPIPLPIGMASPPQRPRGRSASGHWPLNSAYSSPTKQPLLQHHALEAASAGRSNASASASSSSAASIDTSLSNRVARANSVAAEIEVAAGGHQPPSSSTLTGAPGVSERGGDVTHSAAAAPSAPSPGLLDVDFSPDHQSSALGSQEVRSGSAVGPAVSSPLPGQPGSAGSGSAGGAPLNSEAAPSPVPMNQLAAFLTMFAGAENQPTTLSSFNTAATGIGPGGPAPPTQLP